MEPLPILRTYGYVSVTVALVTLTFPPLVIEVEFKLRSDPEVPIVVKSQIARPPLVDNLQYPAVPVFTALADVTVPNVSTPAVAVPKTPAIVKVTKSVPVGPTTSAFVGAAPV